MIDLHTHSTASDGTDSPAQLVALAKDAGVTALAITDHDTTTGWDEASTAAQELGVQLILGAEISATHEGRSVHILSYLHDPTRTGLSGLLARTRQARLDRLLAMTELLSHDFPITWADVLAQTTSETTLGRPHIADALVAAGVVPNRDAAFAELVSPRGPYYVRYEAAGAAEVVSAIVESGGVAVVAHPFAAGRGRGLSDAGVAELVESGLAGLEVWHREMDSTARQRALTIVDSYGLLALGSSDYHGAGKPNRLGEHWTTAEVLAEIVERGALLPIG